MVRNFVLRKNPPLPRKVLSTFQLQYFSPSFIPSLLANTDIFSMHTKCIYLEFSYTVSVKL